jgi:hypothetical protein
MHAKNSRQPGETLMFPTAFTHNITQFARTLSLPERIQHSPARNLSLETLRRRNTTLDALFYDVKSVTADEAFYISDCLAAEGAILIVPPTGGPPLKLCDTLDDFLMAGGPKIDTLAVAGVGSSALGSAAFARNIADAIDKPVAVVISGYGLADVMTEAMGGYFLFGYLNSVRHSFEMLDELFGRPQFGAAPKLSAEKLSQASLDTQTLKALLSDTRLSFSLLLGHSKGNLVVSEALYSLRNSDKERLAAVAESCKIVTLSARIAMPPEFKDVVDVMGEWDWFGEINSRTTIASDEVVAKAWHHTNTELPNHLPVTEVLRRVLARPSQPAATPVLALAAPVPVPALAILAVEAPPMEAEPLPTAFEASADIAMIEIAAEPAPDAVPDLPATDIEPMSLATTSETVDQITSDVEAAPEQPLEPPPTAAPTVQKPTRNRLGRKR